MTRLPSLFISHGAPTFALEPGLLGPKLTDLGHRLPRPQAVLVVSAHWRSYPPRVSVVSDPETIHDFGGFDPELYHLNYPAKGFPVLAKRALQLLSDAGWQAQADEQRGLDHGAWVPLRHLFPDADVPVFQVSMPQRFDAESAWSFGQALAPLAEEGVLIVGSGSLTHNLYEFRGVHGPAAPYVVKFVAWVREAATQGDWEQLKHTLELAPDAQRAHPTPEHFWPLLVAAGAADPQSPGYVIDGGIDYGMLAMDAFTFGWSAQLADGR